MKIAIVGSGYVGMRAATKWKSSYEVVVTTRNSERRALLQQMGLASVIHNPSNSASWDALLPSIDALVLCIAPDSSSNYESCYLNSAKALAESLRKTGFRPQILYTSSTSVYLENRGQVVTEKSPTVDESYANRSILVEAEQVLLDVGASILRLGEIYGPTRSCIDRLRLAAPLPGNGSQITNLTHVDDIVGFLEFCMSNKLSGVFNVCGNTHITRKELYNKLCNFSQLPHCTWDPTKTPVHSSNKYVSNQKILDLGYKLKHPQFEYPLAVAFSPCPNDTFIFHAWVQELIDTDIPIYPILKDINTLNTEALQGTYPLTKLSFYALGNVLDAYQMLSVGAALGFGCGPKIISKTAFHLNELSSKRIAIPGNLTTAHLLLELLLPSPKEKVFCTYDQIFELLESGSVDCGLIIHEQRFIYEKAGYLEIVDLGAVWEEKYHLPLPLGCIAAKRSLGTHLIDQLTKYLRDSILYAKANPSASSLYITEHAQVKDLDVTKKHIDLYVNEESLHLSDTGMKAIELLLSLARDKNLIPQ